MNIDPKTITGEKAREIRKTRGLDQTRFWSAVGVTQPAGCRYESGRAIPKPVRLLLSIAYGEKPYRVVAAIRGEK